MIDGRPAGRTIDMYTNLNVLTIRKVFKLQIFRFLMYIMKESTPFYDFILRPLEITHAYGTRRRTYRQPMLSCEIERRGVVNQIILLYNETNLDQYSTLQLKLSVKKYKKMLLERPEQHD